MGTLYGHSATSCDSLTISKNTYKKINAKGRKVPKHFSVLKCTLSAESLLMKIKGPIRQAPERRGRPTPHTPSWSSCMEGPRGWVLQRSAKRARYLL